MNTSAIASLLLLDGLTNGAVYALLAISIVLVFTVTRVIFIPQGEYVAYAALTVGVLQTGQLPGTVWLLLVLAGAVTLLDAVQGWRRSVTGRNLVRGALKTLAWPVLACAATFILAPVNPPLLVQALLAVALVTPMGTFVYRLAYRSISDASVLVLLIVSVGVHFALTGLGLLFFGAEGFRIPALWDGRFNLGPLVISGQTIIIFIATAVLIVLLYGAFDRTFWGKALRATAVNRTGAGLMGISVEKAGALSFTLAAFIGAWSGLLLGPTTTVFYDTGFLIGLKGFVAAVFGGLASFPGALAGALLVGCIEAFGSFWASAFKEVIVFGAILPILLWRSFRDPHLEEH
jgi:branched-chain amino acid transport system permease protein